MIKRASGLTAVSTRRLSGKCISNALRTFVERKMKPRISVYRDTMRLVCAHASLTLASLASGVNRSSTSRSSSEYPLMKVRASLRSEEHTSELQSLMRISYAVFCLKKKIKQKEKTRSTIQHTRTNNIN